MVTNKGVALQDPFLNTLRKERIPVSIFLVNGIKLQGQVDSFDQFVVLLRNSVSQMIYKHAISTIVPTRPVRIPHDGNDEGYGRESYGRDNYSGGRSEGYGNRNEGYGNRDRDSHNSPMGNTQGNQQNY